MTSNPTPSPTPAKAEGAAPKYAITVAHPKHLVAAIGAESDVCFPIPTTRAPKGLTYVWEPRRDCEYWIETPVKRWSWQ